MKLSIDSDCVKLAPMKNLRHTWLALLLSFWLPAQTLAAVLIECEQHAATEVQTVHLDPAVAEQPDCHGVTSNNDSTKSLSAGEVSNDGTTVCFHCSGACHNLKPLSPIAKAQHAHLFDNGGFSRLDQATAAGVHSNPSRPPCLFSLS